MNKQICMYPFSFVQINYDGEITCCCFIPYENGKYAYTYGNVFEQDFDEIWNGEKAKKFRQDVLDGKYTFCALDSCKRNHSLTWFTENPDDVNLEAEYPERIMMDIDNTCNVRCIMCRDNLSVSKYKELDSEMQNKLLKILKNAKLLNPCCGGEFFVSSKSQKLVKEAIKIYPDLKYNIFTNGIFCDEKHFNDLNLYKRVNHLRISVHAMTKPTYERIVRGGDFDKVIKNIKWVAKQQELGNITDCKLNFVVSSINYKEMPDFAKFALDLKVKASFWELRQFESSVLSKNIKPFAIFEENHPAHQKLVEVLQNPVFREKDIQLNDKLGNLIKD